MLEKVTGWRPSVALEEGLVKVVAHERMVAAGEDHLDFGVNFGDAAAAKAAEDAEAQAGPKNVLISSVSRKVPLVQAFQAAFRRLNKKTPGMAKSLPGVGEVWGADADPDCVAAGFCDGFWQVPRLEDLAVTDFIDGCKARDIRLVIPTRDGELPWFAHHKRVLANAGIRVLVADEGAVTTCLDKLAFYRVAQAMGLPVIPTYAALEEVPAGSDITRWVVKDRHGAGSKSMVLDVDLAAAARFAEGLENPIFQPFIYWDRVFGRHVY